MNSCVVSIELILGELSTRVSESFKSVDSYRPGMDTASIEAAHGQLVEIDRVISRLDSMVKKLIIDKDRYRSELRNAILGRNTVSTSQIYDSSKRISLRETVAICPSRDSPRVTLPVSSIESTGISNVPIFWIPEKKTFAIRLFGEVIYGGMVQIFSKKDKHPRKAKSCCRAWSHDANTCAFVHGDEPRNVMDYSWQVKDSHTGDPLNTRRVRGFSDIDYTYKLNEHEISLRKVQLMHDLMILSYMILRKSKY